MGYLHTSRFTLENLWQTLDVRMMTLAFANKEWGKSHLRYRPSLTDTQHAITV